MQIICLTGSYSDTLLDHENLEVTTTSLTPSYIANFDLSPHGATKARTQCIAEKDEVTVEVEEENDDILWSVASSTHPADKGGLATFNYYDYVYVSKKTFCFCCRGHVAGSYYVFVLKQLVRLVLSFLDMERF